jgi:hypothetical protein
MKFTDVYYDPKRNKMVLVKKCDAWKDGYKFYTFMHGWKKMTNSGLYMADLSRFRTKKSLARLTYIGEL